MTMPSRVRTVRKTLARSARMRHLAAPRARPASVPPSAAPTRETGGEVGDGCCGPVSATIRPSLISMMRLACAATARSCVIRMTVWPSALSCLSSAITSAPLLLSSAPVGSSARMTCPPFISARAIDTRCCWPPESWFGRWPSAVGEAERGEQLGARALALGRATGRHRWPGSHVLGGVRRADQVVALEDEAEDVAAQPRQLVGVQSPRCPRPRRGSVRRSAGRGSRGCSSASTCRSPTRP